MSNKPSPHEIALIVQGEAKTLVPALIQASREVNADKQHEVLLEIFRKVDSKQNELEIFNKAYNEVVVRKVVVGKKDGKDVVKLETVKSRNIGYLCNHVGRSEIAVVIRLLIINVNNYFNIKDGLNMYQVSEITEQIIDEFGDRLFIDELVYIFKKAKTTAKLYNALDGSIIFKWIDDHYKNKDYHQRKEDAKRKSEGFDLPKFPHGIMKQAIKKMEDKYVTNFNNINDVPKPDSDRKKKDK